MLPVSYKSLMYALYLYWFDYHIVFCLDDNFQYDDSSIPKCDDSTSGLCEGGILTIDGINGNTIWQTWTAFNVFSLYCSEDLNGDTYNDCVASGRGGVSCD